MKRKRETEMDDASSIEHVDGTTTFSDLCDDIIDMILCNLELVDLVNISDTSTRLRGIAVGVFSRKHAHRLICFDDFHHWERYNFLSYSEIRLSAKYNAKVPISGVNIWFKLLRNFGASIKYLRIINGGDHNTKMLRALQNLSKYVSEYCNESLEILDVMTHQYFTLSKPLAKLQEFYSIGNYIDNSEALEMMPNLRSLKLVSVPKSIAKHHAKLERVSLELYNDKQMRTFISFLQLNRQIKNLRFCINCKCLPQETFSIYSSIVHNLTQLKTFELTDVNKTLVDYQLRIESVESFSTESARTRFPFHFNDLKKLTLENNASKASYCMDFILRNKKLKILKMLYLPRTLLNGIEQLLNELPELEQIAVYSDEEQRYSILKETLGTEWEEFEKTDSRNTYRRFRKLRSTT